MSWFELRDMKYGMDFTRGWKIELVSYLANALKDGVKAKETRSQLLIWALCQRVLTVRLNFEKEQISFNKR